MDILRIVGTVVGVVIVASLAGLVIRRFRLKVWQLTLVEVIGFVLLLLGEAIHTGVIIAGIVLLTFGGAGLFYMWFLGGAKRQKAAYEQRNDEEDEAHTQASASDITVPERRQSQKEKFQATPENEVKLLTFIKEHNGCKIADMEQVLGEVLPQMLFYQLNNMLKALKKKSLIETDRKLSSFGVNDEVELRITPEGEAFLRRESPQQHLPL